MKKILFISLLFLGLGLTAGFSQTDKMKEKATEKVEQLNAEIMAGDKSQRLSEAQKDQILNIHLDRMKQVKVLKKEGAEKAQIKVVNKKYNQKIYKDILTKKQKKARKAGKEKIKE